MKQILIALSLLTLRAVAEPVAKSYPAPKAPFIAPAPANGAWSFSLQSPDPEMKGQKRKSSSATTPAIITEVRTTQTGRLRLEEVTFSENKTVQYWYVDGTVLLTKTVDGQVVATNVDPDWNRTSLTVPTGFAGFSWVNKVNYVDVVDFETRPAYHYQQSSEDGLELEAWVDVSSNRPIAFRVGSRTYVYSFASEPPAPLALPEPFLSAEKKVEADITYRKKVEKELVPSR